MIRQTNAVRLACAHVLSKGGTPAAAATKFGVNVSSVRRGLLKMGAVPMPVGRPAANAGQRPRQRNHEPPKYNAISVQIRGGAISTTPYGCATSPKNFLGGMTIVRVFRVSGLPFKTVYLTSGERTHGSGWAFCK